MDAAGVAEDQRLRSRAVWPQSACCCHFPQTPLTAAHRGRHPVHTPEKDRETGAGLAEVRLAYIYSIPIRSSAGRDLVSFTSLLGPGLQLDVPCSPLVSTLPALSLHLSDRHTRGGRRCHHWPGFMDAVTEPSGQLTRPDLGPG